MLDNNVPVFLVTFATQELLLYRNAKTGEAVVGAENVVDSCRYAIVLTRVEAELENPLTGGWKVVEVSLLLCSSLMTDGPQRDQELRVVIYLHAPPFPKATKIESNLDVPHHSV